MKTLSPEIRHIGRSHHHSGAAGAALIRNSTGVSQLAVEMPLAIEVNGLPVATLVCTPGSGDELVAGWCFGQGYLDSAADIARLNVGNTRATVMLRRSLPGGHEWREQLTAGFDASLVRFPDRIGGSPPPRDDFIVPAGELLALVAELNERFHARQNAATYQHAGATDGRSIIVTTYDVDRVNTLDKLIGWSVLAGEPLDELIITVTGNLDAAALFRLSRARARIVACAGSPTVQAVKLAQGSGVTLVGGIEARDPVIYTHPWRIDRS